MKAIILPLPDSCPVRQYSVDMLFDVDKDFNVICPERRYCNRKCDL